MELFRSIRLRLGNSILEKEKSRTRRNTGYSGMNNVRKIGIVWDASRTDDFAALSKLHLQMGERGIDVKILGYYDGKELPDKYTAIRFLSIIKRNELSFFYIPKSTEADVFIRTGFDILIDMNFEHIFPLVYISTLSAAVFKVGLFGSETDSSIFDLMMEIKKPVKADNYLYQIIHYLEMINSGKNSKSDNQ
jgi:hypothetical protein